MTDTTAQIDAAAAGPGAPDDGRAEGTNDGARILQPSLVELVAERLSGLIFSGVFAPGERLREERLTAQFGISRPPLREALRVLVEQGLLERMPRRGVSVASFSETDRREIYTLRHALELFAVEEAFPGPSATGVAAMEAALAAMWGAARRDDAAGVIAANRSFHIGLVSLAGHQRLLRVYGQLMGQMQLYMSVNLRSEAQCMGDLGEGCKRHEHLLAAVRSGARDRVVAALDHHGSSRYIAGERQ